MTQTSVKATVKSCSCRQCKRGKHHASFQIKQEERAARRRTKEVLRKDPEAVVVPAHNGAVTD